VVTSSNLIIFIYLIKIKISSIYIYTCSLQTDTRECYAKIFSRIKLNVMKIGKGKLSLNNLDELRVSCMIMLRG
jgi:hypothetical protein